MRFVPVALSGLLIPACGVAPSGSFSPLTVPDVALALEGWKTATINGGSITDGGAVSTWLDQSASATTFTAPSSAERPTYSSSVGGILFNSNSTAKRLTASSTYLSTANAFTVIARLKPTSSPRDQQWMFKLDEIGGGGALAFACAENDTVWNKIGWGHASNLISGHVPAAPDPVNGTTFTMIFKNAGGGWPGSATVSINGVSQTVSTPTGPGTGGGVGTVLGHWSNTVDNEFGYYGYIIALYFVNRLTTVGEDANFLAYLSTH